jgi:hypothetical protein
MRIFSNRSSERFPRTNSSSFIYSEANLLKTLLLLNKNLFL